MNTSTLIEAKIDIQNLIYTIRGQQVMLDSDLAKLYGYEVKRLNEQVKRNINRFPEDFMFQLTIDEVPDCLKSQFATLNNQGNKRGQHLKKLPYAFTEQGIYMLATVLKGEIAEQQSIYIMRAFREMRHYLIENKSLIDHSFLNQINTLTNTTLENTKDIQHLKNEAQNYATKEDIAKIMENFIDSSKIKDIVILNGEKFEADIAYKKIYDSAKTSIILIDEYISIDTLDKMKHLSNSIAITIISNNKGSKDKLQLSQYKHFLKMHPNTTLIESGGIFHDRYILIDYNTLDEALYLSGASTKDAGSKICSIARLKDISSSAIKIKQLLTNKPLTF